MDPSLAENDRDPVVVTGAGWEASGDAWDCLVGLKPPLEGGRFRHDCAPVEFLQARKSLKFMSRQDKLAVSAAGRALRSAGLAAGVACAGVGVFLCTGYIPFEREEAEELSALSQEDGRFSMKAFCSSAYQSINPIKAFTCLPNLPAHHVAVNFSIQGEYFITYPGTPEFYLALQEAVRRLVDRSVPLALAGAVADQANFLVTLHHRKVEPASPLRLADGAAFLVLELESEARRSGRRPLARLELEAGPATESGREENRGSAVYFGAAELPLQVCGFLHGPTESFRHRCRLGGGFQSSWTKLHSTLQE